MRLRAVVQSIDADAGDVTLTTGEVVRGETIVAAVPLPVLSRLWDDDAVASSAPSGTAIGGKISVQFDRRIWQDYGRNGTVLTERAWGHLWETTDDQSGDRGVLTNLLSSHDGAAFAALARRRPTGSSPRSTGSSLAPRVLPANGCTPTGPTTR